MDKDWVIGLVNIIKGLANEAGGKAVGDGKFGSEGKANEIDGEIQNIVGALKVALHGE